MFSQSVAEKSVIIMGSSRSDGGTMTAIRAMDPKSQIRIVDLGRLDISPYDYEGGNSNDDYIPLMESLLKYDNLILATPVYWYTMSGQMKIFIDRLTDLITIRKDIGRDLANKSIFVLAAWGGNRIDCFEFPFKHTAEYMNMKYGGCFFFYTGDDASIKTRNSEIKSFQRRL